MLNLPPPVTLLEVIKEELPKQPKRTNTDHSLSSHLGGLAIDNKQDDRRLPSIHTLLNGTPASNRRLSVSSMHSLTSGCSTPLLLHLDLNSNPVPHPNSFLGQNWGGLHCSSCGMRNVDQENGSCSTCDSPATTRPPRQAASHISYPYPTPQNSPVQKSMKMGKSSASRRSPRHWRYSDSPESTNSHRSARSRQGSESSDFERPKTRKERNKKAQREFCGRQALSGSLADVQNICLDVNPHIATLAAPRPGVPNGGWRPLKSNNINKDIENPLFVNKADALASGTLIIQQSTSLLEQTVDRLRAEGLHELADELAYCTANRGCVGFHFLGNPRSKL